MTARIAPPLPPYAAGVGMTITRKHIRMVREWYAHEERKPPDEAELLSFMLRGDPEKRHRNRMRRLCREQPVS